MSALVLATASCTDDGPAVYRQAPPIEIDAQAEARSANGGALYEFVVDENGFVSAPPVLPAGPVVVTLTYAGEQPAPHSLVFEGLNGDQPIVAVDLPGSNNGILTLAAGQHVYFDGAPGNRGKGYEGRIHVDGEAPSAAAPSAAGIEVIWATRGLAFVTEPERQVPADHPLVLTLAVADRLPHSIALVGVRDEQPLVAVDGPGGNRRTIELPVGTYTYFCAVPGHREAGMEGTLLVG